jgi:hypothetical protein
LARNNIRGNFCFQIYEMLGENGIRTKMNYRKFLCAFTESQIELVRLRFDKMMLRFVYFPVLGLLADENE